VIATVAEKVWWLSVLIMWLYHLLLFLVSVDVSIQQLATLVEFTTELVDIILRYSVKTLVFFS